MRSNRRLTPHTGAVQNHHEKQQKTHSTYRGSSPSPREATEDSLHIQRQFKITMRSNRSLTPHTVAVQNHHEKQQMTHCTYRGSSSSPREATEVYLHIQRQFKIIMRSNRRLTPHTVAVHHHHEKQLKTHSTYRGSSPSPREATEVSLHIQRQFIITTRSKRRLTPHTEAVVVTINCLCMKQQKTSLASYSGACSKCTTVCRVSQQLLLVVMVNCHCTVEQSSVASRGDENCNSMWSDSSDATYRVQFTMHHCMKQQKTSLASYRVQFKMHHV